MWRKPQAATIRIGKSTTPLATSQAFSPGAEVPPTRSVLYCQKYPASNTSPVPMMKVRTIRL